ncbi:MAG TPA: ATP-binding protein [Tepidisphaeraceae bacterium]|nr:ATP-binding protein [Tepidisphaeraceae bacterium]
MTDARNQTSDAAPATVDAAGAALPSRPSGRWRTYVIAVTAVIAAAFVRQAFTPILGQRAPYWTFHIALVVSAWFGGLLPGLLATALGAVAAVYLFVNPAHELGVQTAQDAISLGIYCFIGVVVSLLTESLHRAQLRAERASVRAQQRDTAVRDIMEHTTDAIAVFDRDWRFVTANERAMVMLRRSAEALAAGTFWTLFPQTVGSELQQRLTRAMETQAPDRFETYFAGLDLWAEVQVSPAPEGLTLFFNDTTAAHATARQRAVMAAINEAARSPGNGEETAWAIVSAVGRLLGVARCTVADVDVENGVVHVFRDYLDGVDSIAGMHRLDDYGAFLERETRQGRTVAVNDVSADPRIDVMQRAVYARMQIGAFVAVPLMRDGRAVGQFNVHSVAPRAWPPEDVNMLEQAAARTWSAVEAARAAQSLRRSEQRLRLALEAGQLGVWDWDLITNRVSWSDRIYGFHGLDKDEVGIRLDPDLPLIHPDDRPLVLAARRHTLETGEPYQIEFRAIQPDGSARWLFTNGSLIRNDALQPVRMLGATIDISERKRQDEQREQLLESERNARAEAERAGRMKDEFLATLSHELRTPLNAILGWSQLIRAGRMPNDELQHGLETIERNARAQAQLIDDLLDMSRIISGKVRLDVQPLDLVDVATAAVATVRPTAEAKEITLAAQIGERHCPISGDVNRLQQVLWNLLSNAIKFTPRGGRVTLAVRCPGGAQTVEIVVTDTGQGITPDFLPHVFDRFRQADASTTRRHGGLGIGLAIVKHLVEMHGGTVTATSDGAGHGAVFTISLPLIAGLPTTLPAESPSRSIAFGEPAHEPTLAGVRVLVVDDEADARDLASHVLTGRGASVAVASSAAEALDGLVSGWPFDVLVSDIGLPGEDGYALIRQVRSLDGAVGGKVPAIALTAYARAEDRTRAILAGYQVHLTKPIEPSELLANVASLAGRTGSASPAAPTSPATVGTV